ncbi:MAG: hypothetical protein QOJ22_1388 [Thermoleophilaceae bacterium]|nr:hypothetical protein [Thermoleophilaceae bacterium]
MIVGLRSTERAIAYATAIASIAAGLIHVSAAVDHENLPVMMAGFLIVAALQVALGGLLIWRRPGRRLIAAGAGLMVSAVGLWLVSRTVGLPLLRGGHMEPVGFKDGVTVLFELAALPGLLLLSRDPSRLVLPGMRFRTQALGAIATAAVALTVPALIADGGHHHSRDQAVALGIHDGGGHGENPAGADAEQHAGEAGADDHGGPTEKHRDAGGRSGSGHPGHDTTELAALGPGASHGHRGDTPDGGSGEHDGGGGEHDGGGGGGDHAPRPDGDRRRHGHGDDRRPAKEHRPGHGRGKDDGNEHEHEHPPEEPENDGPLAQLADALPAVGNIPPLR